MASSMKRPSSAPEPSPKKACTICQRNFSTGVNLNKHIKLYHPSAVGNVSDESLAHPCHLCSSQFKALKNLRYHLKSKHSITLEKRPRSNKMHKCPKCVEQFCMEDMDEHLYVSHGIRIDTQQLQFETFQDFDNWKASMEKTSKSNYSKRSSNKKNNEYHYYRCNRSGEYLPQGKGVRHIKVQGSCKIQAYCPASIKVNVFNGKCEVTYCSTHVGHDTDLSHLRLSKEERTIIAGKIASKIPFDDILDDIRDNVGPCLERRHLLTKQDLRNIENLMCPTTVHANDKVSTDILLKSEKMKKIVLFYKEIGSPHDTLDAEDLMIILMNKAQLEIFKQFSSDCITIDSTHGLNEYGYQLVTLLVLDDLRQGFPCAYMISNRIDQVALKIFFSFIKRKAGIVKPQVFMSDMAESFYNAWVDEMDIPVKRLFCCWHVDRAWRKNLSKISNLEKQAGTYKILRTLLCELDENSFEIMLPKAIEIFQNDVEVQLFGEYFSKQYGNNPKLWAFCYRKCSGLNTNMHVESMHRILKHIYLRGKKTKRLDKTLMAIMKLIRDKLFDRLIVNHKGKLSSKVRCLRKRHAASKSLSSTIAESAFGFLINSTDGSKYYVLENTGDCACNVRCDECKACIHRFSCSCMDYCIKWNMCKHIHYLCTKFPVVTTEVPESVAEFIDKEQESILECLTNNENHGCPSENESSFEDVKIKIMQSFEDQLKDLQNRKEAQLFLKHLRRIQSIVHATRAQSTESIANSDRTPANKNVELQRRFMPAKKSTKKSRLAKPTPEESQKIALELVMGHNKTIGPQEHQEEIVVSHQGLDIALQVTVPSQSVGSPAEAQ